MRLFSVALYLTCVVLSVIEISSVAEIVREKQSLIYFYSPDCRYCNAFQPLFEYLVQLYERNEHFQIVKVNCRKSKELCSIFQIQSYPTFKIYDSELKQVYTFTNTRSVENLDDFISTYTSAQPELDNINITVSKIDSISQLEALKKPAILAIASSDADWNTYYYPSHFFHRLSKEYPNISFAISFADVADSAILKHFHVSNFPSMIFFEELRFRLLNTLSTNIFQNELLELEVQAFLQDSGDSKWFALSHELAAYAEQLQYEGHKQFRGGMNVGTGEKKVQDLQVEYQKLIDEIGI